MGFLDNLTEMATDLAQSGAAASKRLAETGVATSKRLAEIAKLTASSLAEEGGIKKAYVELGKLYYAEHGATPEAACEKISAAKATIEANNNRIAQLKAEAKADGEVIDDAEIQDAVEAEIVEEEAEAPAQTESPVQEEKPEG